MPVDTQTPFVVTVAGISAKLGRSITNYLLAKPHVEVHGLTRDPSKAPRELLENTRIRLFPNSTPTDTASLCPAVRGASIVICTYLGSPTFEREAQMALIDACISEGVPRYMCSDFTTDYRKVAHEVMPQKKANREVNSYLEAKERDGSIKGVHVLNGGFMESLFSYGFLWFRLGEDGGVQYWGTGDETWEMTSYETAARYIAEVAVDETATGWFNFLGDRKSVNETVALLREIHGQGSIIPTKRLGSFDDLVRSFQDGFAREPDDEGFDAWRRFAYLVILSNGKTYLDQPLHNERYPHVQPDSLKDWLSRYQVDDLIKSAWF